MNGVGGSVDLKAARHYLALAGMRHCLALPST